MMSTMDTVARTTSNGKAGSVEWKTQYNNAPYPASPHELPFKLRDRGLAERISRA